jgi:glutathione S-transferase
MSEPARLPLLYSYRRCPYAMRARLALLWARREFDIVDISLRNKPAAMLALSPKGTVPVLHLPDGQVLVESWDIMRWAFETDDAHGCWARAQSATNLEFVRRNDGDFKRHLDRYKYQQRDLERYSEAVPQREAARATAVTLLLPLEAALQQQPHLGGAMPCAADLAVFPFVRQFAAVDPGWFDAQPLPALHAWLAGWLRSALFEACMAKERG